MPFSFYAFTPLCFRNPLVSVFPRVLVGFCGAVTFRLLSRRKLPKGAALPISGAVGSLVNTVLVLGMIYVAYSRPVADLYAMTTAGVLPMLLGVIATNGVAEATSRFVKIKKGGM